MRIFDEEPKDWVDLQNKVAYVLRMSGFNVETPKKLQSVRSEVEVDVYGENTDIIIICECKYWESNIPQNVIFAFRTIVDDIGANKGIIISKKGFQSGAYSSIKNTNIDILTWYEFLEGYKEKYLKAAIKKFLKIKSKLYRLADNKHEYWGYYDKLEAENRFKAHVLQNRLMKIVLQMSQLCFMLQNEEDEEIGWDIDYIDKIIIDARENWRKEFCSYCDFFEFINEEVNIIVSEFEDLYGTSIL